MKKSLLLLFFTVCSITNAQTKIVALGLDLERPKDRQLLLNGFNNETNEVYSFVSDKEKITLLRFNSALFFSDSLATKRPAKEYTSMLGYSVQDNKYPFVYWGTEDLKKIVSQRFDLASKTILTAVYSLPLENETVLTTFNKNNAFYILCVDDKLKKLQLYIFKNGNREQQTFDFETYNFVSNKGTNFSLNKILQDYPLEFVDTSVFNSLASSTSKTKLYVTKDKLVLTFDHNTKETQLFEIDLSSYIIKETKIAQPELKDAASQSNSFLDNERLYQLRLNSNGLAFAIKDLKTAAIVQSYTVSAKDAISFKNSPLYSQTGDRRPKVLKNTEKLLDRLSDSDVGLSIYKQTDNILVTIGGTRQVANGGIIALQAAVSIGGIATGTGGGDMGGLFDNSNLQLNYFETVFNSDFKTITTPQTPLAVDLISQFTTEEDDLILGNTVRYKDFYILGYYDNDRKEFVMRKFEDVSVFH